MNIGILGTRKPFHLRIPSRDSRFCEHFLVSDRLVNNLLLEELFPHIDGIIRRIIVLEKVPQNVGEWIPESCLFAEALIVEIDSDLCETRVGFILEEYSPEMAV